MQKVVDEFGETVVLTDDEHKKVVRERERLAHEYEEVVREREKLAQEKKQLGEKNKEFQVSEEYYQIITEEVIGAVEKFKEELKQEVERLKKELEQKESKIQRLQAEVRSFPSSFPSRWSENKWLQLSEENRRLRRKLRDKNAEIDGLQDTILGSTARVAILMKENEKLHKDIKRLQADAARYRYLCDTACALFDLNGPACWRLGEIKATHPTLEAAIDYLRSVN